MKRSPLVALFGLLLAVGCGGDPTGNITGQVRVGDAPLPAGTITFLSTDGQVVSGNVEDGGYELAEVPTGEYKLAVQSHPPAPQVVPPTGPVDGETPRYDPTDYLPVPDQYHQPDTSGLTYTVTEGDQTHDVEIPE